VTINSYYFGQKGENLASSLLTSANYQIIERNFRTKIGEIDIIALHENRLVFIEVKTRHSLEFGYPEEAVTQSKIATVAKVGEYYSKLHPELPQALRIDVLAIGPKDKKGKLRIKLFKNVQEGL